MRKSAYIISISLFIAIVQACGKTDIYAEKSKTLDSLSGAVNSVVRELEKTDTITLRKYLARFEYYQQFIRQNIDDTIGKNEADNLRHFYTSGKNLENYAANRYVILARASLINSQLLKLAMDIQSQAISTDQLPVYTSNEKNEVGKLIEAAYHQQKIFYSGMEEFRNSLNGVELLIRSRNHGELPVIVKDSLSL
jgi:hypothetical protein